MRYLPFFILINALICSTAIADPKSDIEAYSKAFEIGDYDKGTALLTEALASAKKELSPGSPLLAKIAYDYCLNQVIINAPEKAKDALAIFQKSMELNPKLAENSSTDEIMLVEAIIKAAVSLGNKPKYSDVAALNKAIEKYSAKYPYDNLVLNAYRVLIFGYQGLAEWSKLAKSSDELLIETEYFKDLSPNDRKS